MALHTPHAGERRSAHRMVTWLRVDFCPLVSRRSRGLRIGQLQRGIALNVSRGGMYVSDAGHLQVGALLHLFVRVPDAPTTPVVCYAKVVRHDNQGYGVRFLRLRETDKRRLDRYLDGLLDARLRSRQASAS